MIARISRLLVLLGLALLLTVSCGDQPQTVEEPVAAPPAQPPVEQPTIVSEAAFALLVQQSVFDLNSDAMLAAGIENIRQELNMTGVVAPEIRTPAFGSDIQANLAQYRAVVELAIEQYGSKLSPVAINHAAIRGFVDEIDDCHTSFLSPDQFAEQVAWLTGEMKFGGIGAMLRKPADSDLSIIVHVFKNGPASEAGLRTGDRIVAVDGENVSEMGLREIVDLIRGVEGAEVVLTVLRAGERAPTEIRIVRASISPPGAEYEIIDDRLGYVRLYAFSQPATEEFDAAIREFSRRNLAGWIIDLRGNSGGALASETAILSKLIDQGLLFYVWGRDGQREDFHADGSIIVQPPPIVVLVDEASTSGAEIMAATIQEQRLGAVVGTRTAGCVGVGRLFQLPDGSALQVTVGRLFTGVRNSDLNRVGVVPDYEVDMLIEDIVAGVDPQMSRAVELLRPAAKAAS